MWLFGLGHMGPFRTLDTKLFGPNKNSPLWSFIGMLSEQPLVRGQLVMLCVKTYVTYQGGTQCIGNYRAFCIGLREKILTPKNTHVMCFAFQF